MNLNKLRNIGNYLLRRYSQLDKIGQGDINLIDIGSSGNLPEPWNKNTKSIKHLLKFEPRDKPTTNKHITTVDCALWSSTANKDFYIYKGLQGSGSSLYKQNYEYVENNYTELSKRGSKFLAETWYDRSQLVRTEKIQCDTLDNILFQLNQPWQYHFIKIDAQGAEYEILKGAENILRNSCIGLHMELFIYPLYKGIRLMDEIIEYLQTYNFKLIKKYPAHGSFESQHDCIFLKDIDNNISQEIKSIYELRI